jgi:DNA repair photolyase
MTDHDDLPDPAPWIARPKQVRKGRGAVSNMSGRFEEQIVEITDDGWWQDEEELEPAPVSTQIIPETAKSILNRNQSPDLPFSVSLNPYRGCEHGCVYCFARPTHSYLGLSPGLDFETRIYAKTNAPELLRRELAAPSYEPLPIALGVNTDAYQPCERQLGITRRVLGVLCECRHPVGLITKSSLIERDLDLLQEMASRSLVTVAITLTTLDHSLSRLLEPRATSPSRRLQTIRRLSAAGIPVSVSVAPIIPHITEPELENVLNAAMDAGATWATYVMLRLPWEVNPLFQEWLQAHFPLRAEKVLNCIRDMRGGRENDANFGSRMRGEGLWADLIRQRFKRVVKNRAIADVQNFRGLDSSQFRRPLVVPPRAEVPSGQADLFG